MVGLEQKEQTRIQCFLNSLGWYVVNNISTGKSGVLDLSCCTIIGQYVAIEVKKDRHELPTPLQFHNIDLIRRAGGVAFHCYSLDSLKEKLEYYSLI